MSCGRFTIATTSRFTNGLTSTDVLGDFFEVALRRNRASREKTNQSVIKIASGNNDEV
jgi:hypothetical protein